MKISILGMGYVGLPLAVALSKHYEIVGFDIDEQRITELKNNIDKTNECSSSKLSGVKVTYTCNVNELPSSDIFIITVPTPIDDFNTPNLDPLKSAAEIVAKKMEKGAIVVIESTVYPGTTIEVIAPILKKYSGLNYLEDFTMGYSPERINPGDNERKLETIPKIISACDKRTCDILLLMYSKIINAKLHVAESIEVAEAAKVIENIQRDVNIALINELKMVFDRKKIDVYQVLEAASTKWNFHSYFPGLVGGHCIGVDPYYLSHSAKKNNFETRIVNSARQINSTMANYEAISFCKKLFKKRGITENLRVLVMGVTFKENCPDIRNSQVPKLIAEMEEFGISVDAIDPYVGGTTISNKKIFSAYSDISSATYDGIFIAVPHTEFIQIGLQIIRQWIKPNGYVYDLKNEIN